MIIASPCPRAGRREPANDGHLCVLVMRKKGVPGFLAAMPARYSASPAKTTWFGSTKSSGSGSAAAKRV